MARQPLLRWPWASGAPLDEAEAAELAAELRRANLPATATAAEYQTLLARLLARLRGPARPQEAPDAE